MTRRLALILCALALGGCKARAPGLELECVVHPDCALTSLRPDCCDGCEARLGNKSSVAALTAWCERQPARSCPKIDCPGTVQTPMCERERCLARPGVHQL